ncbi:hypothetical protein [Streptomyces sp. HSG2]|uniref:hypothetical protein n=1 Tax=Streptomyces sp. HSG2 TaxID=2797167 RepID=UPI0019053EF3|nr:hypothetical protein [Streptomyces sp. HSG2]
MRHDIAQEEGIMTDSVEMRRKAGEATATRLNEDATATVTHAVSPVAWVQAAIFCAITLGAAAWVTAQAV